MTNNFNQISAESPLKNQIQVDFRESESEQVIVRAKRNRNADWQEWGKKMSFLRSVRAEVQPQIDAVNAVLEN